MISEAAKNLEQYLYPVKGFKHIIITKGGVLVAHYTDDKFLSDKYVKTLEQGIYQGHPVKFAKNKE